MGKSKTKEIVVFSVRGRDSECADCKGDLSRGGLLVKEGEKGLCMSCADLDHLVFLPAGDAALTLRAGKYTGAKIVLVRFSRPRRRYERQGIFVTEEALERAEQECLGDAGARARARARAAVRRAELDREYVQEFVQHIRKQFPGCPEGVDVKIVEHACRKYSNRVGRSAAAREFDKKKIKLAVQAHVRHQYTDYDEILFQTSDRPLARARVKSGTDRILGEWSAK